jgi:hypothetical protein
VESRAGCGDRAGAATASGLLWEATMLPAPKRPASRNVRDRVYDAGFHASLALIAAAIVLVFAFAVHGPR